MSSGPSVSKSGLVLGLVAFLFCAGLTMFFVAQSANARLILAGCALAVPAIAVAVTIVLLVSSDQEEQSSS